jgi:hypothetical protein
MRPSAIAGVRRAEPTVSADEPSRLTMSRPDPPPKSYVVRATLYVEPKPKSAPKPRADRHHIPKPRGYGELRYWYDNRIEFYTKMLAARRRNPVPPEHAHRLKLSDAALEHELVFAIFKKARLESRLT